MKKLALFLISLWLVLAGCVYAPYPDEGYYYYPDSYYYPYGYYYYPSYYYGYYGYYYYYPWGYRSHYGPYRRW